MNTTTTPSHDNDIPAEVDFTGAPRGKFYRPNLRLNLPVYLDADVQDYLNVIATKKACRFRNSPMICLKGRSELSRR